MTQNDDISLIHIETLDSKNANKEITSDITYIKIKRKVMCRVIEKKESLRKTQKNDTGIVSGKRGSACNITLLPCDNLFTGDTGEETNINMIQPIFDSNLLDTFLARPSPSPTIRTIPSIIPGLPPFKGFVAEDANTGICVSNNSTMQVNTKIINRIFGREQIYNDIKKILESFDNNINNVFFKKGIYIYGSPGCGKTEFVVSLLNDLNYDVIQYDAGDIRNKNLIDSMTSNNLSNYNVLQMMKGVKKKIAIIMDEIDGMNNGDKGGLTSLIKLIRQKKTKKQKIENRTLNPIVCIGNYYSDKKIKELVKVSNTYELVSPTREQMRQLVEYTMPDILQVAPDKMETILNYIQNDLRKYKFIFRLYEKKPEIVLNENLDSIFHIKTFNDDSKINTRRLINEAVPLEKHNTFMNDTDRTIISLLWHENIVDMIEREKDKKKVFSFYTKILKIICYADYIDRITFQNQIWIFNEMTSLMKTFYTNRLYHLQFPENLHQYNPSEVRFTKILTKYSTEYNNILFFFNLCQELDMDRKDLVSFFQEIRMFYGEDIIQRPELLNRMERMFENYNITKLDIKRIYRFLDKNIKKEEITTAFSSNEDAESVIEEE